VLDLAVTAEAGWTGGRRLRQPIAVGVTGQRITWVGHPAAVRASARRLHLPGVLLPGLTDHHVHSSQVDVRALLAGGLTTVVDLGGVPAEIWPLAAGSATAADRPRIHPAGPFLTAPGGYPTRQDWAPAGIAWEVADPESAAAAVRALAPHHPVTIKVALNADAGPVLDDVTLAAVVGQSRLAGLSVTAHVQGTGQAERAAAAGVRTLAHTPWTEILGDALIAHLAQTAVVVSTLDIHGWGTPAPECHTALANLSRFHRAGGVLRYGTDLGNGPLPLGVNGREIDLLGTAGLTGHGILAAMAGSRLARGAVADLTVVPADPLADPATLSHAVPVLKSGIAVGQHVPHISAG
jgi:imidazolonepropionase-like amidohydrolase